MGIFRYPRGWASAVAIVVAACGGRTPLPGELGAPPAPLPTPVPLAQAWLLESWGVPAEDTVVTFSAREPRIILLRRGAPDNSVFAEIAIPAGTLTPPNERDSTTITLRPRPGAFGVDVELEVGSSLRAGATLTFSYAVHFVMPEGARSRYGSPIAFERELHVAQVGGDGLVTFLASRRLASDNLTAMLTGPGRYVVATPR